MAPVRRQAYSQAYQYGEEAYRVHWAACELVADDFKVKKLMFMCRSKTRSHIICGSLGAHAVHVLTKFSNGRAL